MAPAAAAREIREAYRARARVLHPDQAGSTASMADLNEAYRILRDPRLRAQYDARLRTAGSAAPPAFRSTTTGATAHAPAHPVDATPARFPWKLVVGMAAVGAAVVLVGAALYEPAEPANPDNVLRPGSCVEVELNNDVREVNCSGADDLVVQSLVAFDESCPAGLSAYRDRQGLGTACVSRTAG